MKSEDGTGSRHALVVLKRCGIVTPPISFISKMVTPVTIFFFFDYHLTTTPLKKPLLTTIDYQNFSEF